MIKISPITTFEMADFLGAPRPKENVLITEISIDTRENFGENTCFVAIEGERFSGNDFIKYAIAKGAKCILSNEKMSGEVSFITVFDTKKALLKLASREIKNTKIIAITGSAGKTTVKEMICSVLSQEYRVHSTYQNHNNEIGVAQTLFSIKDEDFCVVEMGMRGLGEIELLASACSPYVGAITNCGSAHIERLGTKENIFLAKCELLNHTTDFVLVPFEKRFQNIHYGKLRPFFIGDGGDVELGRINCDKTVITVDVIDNEQNKILRFIVPSIYKHDATNALFAYKVGKICGISDENIAKGIMNFKSCNGRGSKFKIGSFEIIDDTYNASFESSEQAVISLASYSSIVKKYSVLIMGDMHEIGEMAKEYHEKIGHIARKYGIKQLICYGNFSKDLCKGFSGGIAVDSREQVVDTILKNVPKESVLLIKASRKMGFEKIIDGLKEKINEY